MPRAVPKSTARENRVRLLRGDLLPRVLEPPPGPVARRLCRRLRSSEAPGINTLYRDADTLLWSEARGSNVLDVDGNRYLDLTSGFGVAAIGHRHPRVVDTIRRQAGRLLHGMGDVFAHPARVELAERLIQLAPVDEGRVYFAVSGADAVEIAIKTAILATGRDHLLVFEPSYHGLTAGALAVSSRPEFRQPFVHHLHSKLHRLPFSAPLPEIEKVLADHAGGRRQIAAVLLEPIVGREGILLPPPGWLAGLARLCRRHDALLVVDEIFTGFGRTGRWFAVDHENVRPDLLCCGKALGGGLPIAAVVGRSTLMDCWQHDGEARHTATFVAHPLACSAALTCLDVLTEEGLPDRARRLGDELASRFEPWREFPVLTDLRGRGLLWGFELKDRATAGQLVSRALHSGLLMLAGGPEGRVAQWVPPLVIHRRQIDHALKCLERLLTDLD